MKRYLQEVVGLPAASRGPVGEAGGLEGPGVEEELERQKKREQRKMEPFVLFGSSFRKDKEYTQVHVLFFALSLFVILKTILVASL